MTPTTSFFGTCQYCGNPATTHIHVARDRRWIEDRDVCEAHENEIIAHEYGDFPSGMGRAWNEESRFDIETLLVKKDVWDARYYLREEGGMRHFTATMGYCEAVALYLHIQHSLTPRPVTHDVLARTIAVLGGSLQGVLVCDFLETENCFRANMRIQRGDEVLLIDARPSDALTLAIVCDVPIFVSENTWRISMKQSKK